MLKHYRRKEKEEDTVSDEVLVMQAKSDDKQAMEALLLRYVGMVRSIARSYFLAGGDTEDLIQEGMIGLYNAVVDYADGGMSFRNFARLCITRRILDAVKAGLRRKNQPLNNYVSLLEEEFDLSASGDALEEMIHREDDEEFFRKMNEALSDLEFRVLTLYMKGLSSAEICAVTKKDEKSVDNALQRSKKKIQKLINKN